jgi:hypothetical protein|tara:strand:- start:153 stop:293 length:141 start_codon:yes stop_codon:yes gene_type:complete
MTSSRVQHVKGTKQATHPGFVTSNFGCDLQQQQHWFLPTQGGLSKY